MTQATLKTIARHKAAVTDGRIERTNVIGIRKALNEMERSRNNPAELIDALFDLTEAIAEHRPTVAGELHDSGLKVLRNPRYAKRWTAEQQIAIDTLDHFTLIRFDWIGPRGAHVVPVYAVWAKVPPVAGVDPFPPGVTYQAFAFRNIPWQSAWSLGEEDGPRVVSEHGE